jgi:hypothetical protein
MLYPDNLTLQTLEAVREKLDALMQQPTDMVACLSGRPGQGILFADRVPLRFIESPYHGTWVQIRFPRTKKKRIQNKWKKDPKNFVWKWNPDIIATPDGLVMSPIMARHLRESGAMFNPRTGQTIFF